ncbi:hypothetical protein PMIN01_13629 [Paraphaeosphaeria minitans]|uniref:Uncharacterized protein n=1 Tax=Paraphaeosphaeria minitans TaxID=565426 RepID=A0A9P6KIJ6_9PLEO|nr:hypothetical protein PMIN01_13629 [Paraphaeosphaeria minitans]
MEPWSHDVVGPRMMPYDGSFGEQPTDKRRQVTRMAEAVMLGGRMAGAVRHRIGARKRFAVGPARRRALMDPSTLPHAGGTGQAAHARKDAFAVGLRFGTPANFARTPSSSPDLRIRAAALDRARWSPLPTSVRRQRHFLISMFPLWKRADCITTGSRSVEKHLSIGEHRLRAQCALPGPVNADRSPVLESCALFHPKNPTIPCLRLADVWGLSALHTVEIVRWQPLSQSFGALCKPCAVGIHSPCLGKSRDRFGERLGVALRRVVLGGVVVVVVVVVGTVSGVAPSPFATSLFTTSLFTTSIAVFRHPPFTFMTPSTYNTQAQQVLSSTTHCANLLLSDLVHLGGLSTVTSWASLTLALRSRLRRLIGDGPRIATRLWHSNKLVSHIILNRQVESPLNSKFCSSTFNLWGHDDFKLPPKVANHD